jgi:hypothetical protein
VSGVLVEQGIPAHFAYLPWNAGKTQELWVASDPAWRARYGAEKESQVAHEARQKAMQAWIHGGR